MLFRIGLGVALALAQCLCWGDEPAERSAITNQVMMAFAGNDFAKIETLHAEAKRQPLTSAGVSKSGLIMEGIATAVHPPRMQPPSELFWQTLQQKLSLWQTAFPASSLAAYARSSVHLARALEARGNQPAAGVDAATWDAFDGYVQKAAGVFREPGSPVQQDEVWQTGMLEAARYERLDNEAFKRLVEAATGKYPEYWPLYYAAARRLRPGSGGSVEDLDWVANLAMERSGGRTGLMPYARVYWNIGGIDYGDTFLDSTLVDWQKLKAGFDDLVKRHPDNWNWSNYAWFACQAHDQATLAGLVQQMRGEIARTLWPAYYGVADCRSLADPARTARFREYIHNARQFRALVRADDFPGIEELYAQLSNGKVRHTSGALLVDGFADFSAFVCPSTSAEREEPAAGAMRAARCRARFDSKMQAWRKRYPDSALPAIGLSHSALDEASSLPFNDTKGQDAAYERARLVLETVPAANRNLHWHLQLMRIGSQQGWGPARFKRVFDEAATRFPDRPGVYRRGVAHFLPRNGGSFADVEAVARTALARNDVPTGLLMYSYAYEEMVFGSGNYQGGAYEKSMIAWPEMSAGLKERNRRYPSAFNNNRFAHHACVAGDMDTLRGLLAHARTFPPDFRDAGWNPAELERCRRRLDALDKHDAPRPKTTVSVPPGTAPAG